jgi:hypothetical protein
LLAGALFAPNAWAATKEPAKPAPLKVAVDVSEVPELKDWADKAGQLCIEWYPKICEMLKSDGFKPRADVKLVFKKKLGVPAYTGGGTITISGSWVKDHPDDWGMVVHELTHVVQAYRRAGRGAGWLVEGIADYVRFCKYEPKVEVKVRKRDQAKAGYRVTARFLGWVEQKYDKQLVNKLNRALREGDYRDALFERYTGKNIDDLWAEYVKSQTSKA